MNRTLKLSAITLFLAFFAGCVSTDGNRGEYFGYSNNPKPREVIVVKEKVIEKEVPSATKKQQWKNPLAEDEYNASDNDQTATDSPTGVYEDNNTVTTRYVPVIVPWWDRYYYDYSYYEPGFHIGFYSGGWWGNDWCWYNPWYDYHPYYGVRWYPHHYYNNWWYDPYYYHPYPGYNVVYNSPKPRSVRTFGPYRGTYSSNDRKNTINNQGTVSSSPRSTGYIPEKHPTGSIGSTRSSGINRSSYLPSATNRSSYSKPSKDYRQNAAPNRTNENGRSVSGNNSTGRSKYVPQSEAPRSSGRSSGNSGNSNRSSYTPPPSSSGGSSGRSSGGSSGGSSSGRSSSGGSSGSSSSGRSSRSGK